MNEFFVVVSGLNKIFKRKTTKETYLSIQEVCQKSLGFLENCQNRKKKKLEKKIIK